jgi:DNA-binding NtrC family response regulator
MVASSEDTINIMLNPADWPWPEAVRDIFQPRGINSLVISDANEAIEVIQSRRIHTAIVDMDAEKANGLATIKVIRAHFPMLPCILVARDVQQELLCRALELEVFSVIEKPVDLSVLVEQLNRLFVRRFNIKIFSQTH